jgi:hypothetical protein
MVFVLLRNIPAFMLYKGVGMGLREFKRGMQPWINMTWNCWNI